MAIQKLRLKKPDDVKLYENKLKNEIDEFLFQFKKRYQKFPSKEVESILKKKFDPKDEIIVSGEKYTVKEIEVEFRKVYRKLKVKSNSSYFNFVIKAYLSDIKKNNDNPKKAYDVYHTQLQSEFKIMWTDLRFCLAVLKSVSSMLKSNLKLTTESSESPQKIFMDDFNSYIRKHDLKKYITSCKIKTYTNQKTKEVYHLLGKIRGTEEWGDILKELSNNVKYDGSPIKFQSCYLPGDVYLFVVFPDMKKESEDITMDAMITLESGDQIALESLICLAYEGWDDDSDFDSINEMITEAVTSDTITVARDATKAVKDTTKKIRKVVKNKNFKEAKKLFAELDKKLADAENAINNIAAGDNFDFAISTIAVCAQVLIKCFILMLPATSFGAAAGSAAAAGKLKIAMVLLGTGNVTGLVGGFTASITEAMNTFNDLINAINKIKNKKELTADDFNPAKTRAVKYVKDLRAIAKRYEKHVEKLEKKDPAVLKEAAEYDAKRIAIYEKCQNGEITVEAREELLESLANQRTVTEMVNDTTEEADDMTDKELYEAVRVALYEKCQNGEITDDQREEMLLEAFDQIFGETTNDGGLDMKQVEKDIKDNKDLKEMDKALKDAEKSE